MYVYKGRSGRRRILTTLVYPCSRYRAVTISDTSTDSISDGSIGEMPVFTSLPSIRMRGFCPSRVVMDCPIISTERAGISERALNGSFNALLFCESLNTSPVAVTLDGLFAVMTTSSNCVTLGSIEIFNVVSDFMSNV